MTGLDSSPMIRLDHVSKGFGRDGRTVRALDNVSLEIRRGEFIAITGPSGSGKTTLLQILGCLDVPTSGSYSFDDTRVDTLDDEALSRLRNTRIGFVFQSFNLISRTTALENVETPLLYADTVPPPGIGLALLEKVGLADRRDHFPTEMSGGEQQRVAIARALIMHPSLLLADEPTGNLDSATGDQILDLFAQLHADGLTVVLITHDPRVASRAQRVIALRDGRLAGPTIVMPDLAPMQEVPR
jgi:putative ABC transport system ATP-binding protein